MRWCLPVLTLFAASVLLFAACGDDDGGKTPGATGTGAAAAAASASPAERALPTPTPVPDTAVAITVVNADKTYTPTLAELKKLPTVDIDVKGKHTGVSLAELARQVGAAPASVVTIQGLTGDRAHAGAVRFALSEVATNTVLALDDQGHLDVYSTKIPEEQWLDVVTGVSFEAPPAASTGGAPPTAAATP